MLTNTPHQVPLDTLVDSRFIEGTYPLFDRSSPDNAEGDDDGSEDGNSSVKPPEQQDLRQRGQHIRKRKTSSCFGGLFDPSLELGVHLYRMGPLNNYSRAGESREDMAELARVAALHLRVPKDGTEVRSSGGGQGPGSPPPIVLWKPPSLVEKGKVGRDGCGSDAVSLFARPQMEPGRIGDTTRRGDDGVGG